MKRPAAILPLLGLAACTHGPAPEPEVRIQEIIVERPIACVPDNLNAAPRYPDTDEALASAADASSRYALLWAGRLLRAARADEVEPVISKCREAAQ